MSDDILSRIDESMARNRARFDLWSQPYVTSSTGEEQPAEAGPDVAPPTPYRCRGCRLWIAQDVKLCGPCSVLPSCPAERSAAEWGGTVACFRPAGHDGQHESVRGRCWMDEPHAEVTVMTHEQAAAATLRHATRSLECGALTVSLRCSGCDGQAMEGGGRCLHDCHEADAPLVDAAPDPDPVTPRRRVAELYAALKARRTRRGGTT